MEHKLIRGGESYLPFARSRIKALRATGMQYATQRFVMAGGEQVRVQIAAEHDYIEISGGGCSMFMDSGVVDVRALSGPGGSEQGILHYTDSASTLYDTVVGTGEGTAEIRYNGRTSSPRGIAEPEWRKVSPLLSVPNSLQIANYITHTSGNFIGSAPFDAQEAGSFSSKATESNPATDPRTWSYTESDEIVLLKKTMAVQCPASIFTGKCRLWIQSVYGRQIYGEKALGWSPEITGFPGRPALLIPAWRSSGDAALYDPVLVDTNSGIWVDSSTGDHWLLCPRNGGSVQVYPLRAGACASGMRKTLVDMVAMPEPGHTRLEAFILSDSRPDVADMQTISSGAAIAMYSLGYGWHWNWSGTQADIVINDPIVRGDVGSAMQSTHYRMTVEKSDAGVWSASVSTISGPSEWGVNRLYWCISEPLWTSSGLQKTTQKFSLPLAGSATIYAFYNRDELKTCQIDVSLRSGETIREWDPPEFAEGLSPGDTEFNTEGLRGGYLIETTDSASYHAIEVTIGGVTACADIPDNRILTGQEYLIDNKSDNSYRSYFSGNFAPYTFGYYLPYYYGYAGDGGPGAYQVEYLRGIEYQGSSGTNYDYEVSDIQDTVTGITTIIVPLGDAEAVYVHSSVRTYREKSAQFRQTWSATNFAAVAYCETTGGIHLDTTVVPNVTYTDVAGLSPEYIRYTWSRRGAAYGHTLLSTTTPPPTTSDISAGAGKLFSIAGASDAEFGDLSQFHNEIFEFIGVNFWTISGTGVDQPVVVAKDRLVEPIGAPDVKLPVLVGWI